MTISQGEPLRLYGTLLGKRSTGIAEWYFTQAGSGEADPTPDAKLSKLELVPAKSP